MNLDLKNYKEQLYTVLLSHNSHDGFIGFIDQLKHQGYPKKDIYDLFLDFHREVQVDVRTRGNEKLYDQLSNFMDGITGWGKGFRILPEEPDL